MQIISRFIPSRAKQLLTFSSRPFSIVHKMDGDGLMLRNILEKLESFASTKLAETWDNVGLLIDPMVNKPIRKLMLTNDLTENVMKEALDLNVEMIVTYHPLIFKGLKSLTSKTWQERVVINCIKNEIPVFSPHSSWDVVKGGVNDWLAQPLEASSNEPLTESGAGRLCRLGEPLSIQDLVTRIKTHIGIPHLRLALAVSQEPGSKVSTVALCAGSGTSVLAGVKADLYLTGEMLHHDVLEANHNGTHVILCNHSDSERGFLKSFARLLEHELLNGAVRVIVSKVDSDPLKTV